MRERTCVCACGGISRSARWERDRGVNSDAVKRWRGSERTDVDNLRKKRETEREKAVTKD